MTPVVHVKAKLVPWDDPEFVQAYEQTHAEVEASGCCPDGHEAAYRVQHLLRERGYPKVVIEVEQSPEEALEHIAHWTVSRDG